MNTVYVNEVLKILCKYSRFITDNQKYSSMINEITNLSVEGSEQEPKTKSGHWIKEESIYGWDGKSYQCSICGRSIHLDTVMEDLLDYPYCHCGAKMESEG